MAGRSNQAPRLEECIQQRTGTPPPGTKDVSLLTPVTREAQRRQYNNREDLSITATAPFVAPTAAVTAASRANAAAPPATFAAAIRQPTGDPLCLPSLPIPSRYNAPLPPQNIQLRTNGNTESNAGKQRGHSPGAETTKRVLSAKCEVAEDDTAANNDGGYTAHGIFTEKNCPRDFQCPRVPQMVLALLVLTALVQSFSSSAISLFINMTMKLGPVEVTWYWMYIGYTAWCQPAIGYLSDALVLFGEKRRPLFIIAAAGNVIIFLLYCVAPSITDDHSHFVAMSIVSQFFTMGLYIPLNGLVVEVGRHDAETEEESTARMSAIMSKTMVWRSFGSLMGNILQTFLVFRLSVRSLLGVTSLLLVILIPVVLVTPRHLFLRAGSEDQNFYKRVAEAGRLVWSSFKIRDIRSDGFCFVIVLVFVFVYTMMPDASIVYYNYLYGAFTFPAWFYAFNNCMAYLGSIVGAYVFSLWMDHRARQEAYGAPRTSMFFIFTIGSFAWGFGYVTNLLLCTGFVTETLGVPAHVYVPVDNFFMSMFVRFAFMPTITMAAEHAPKFFEATAFEVFSVASIGGGTISSLLTAIIAQDLGISRTDYSQMWVLILISIVLKLVPIPLAYLLPERRTSAGDAQPTIEGDDGARERAEGERDEREEGGEKKAMVKGGLRGWQRPYQKM